jgi:hypothetical protein
MQHLNCTISAFSKTAKWCSMKTLIFGLFIAKIRAKKSLKTPDLWESRGE